MAIKNIDYYLNNPSKLLEKQPFVRGGELDNATRGEVGINDKIRATLSELKMQEITQDDYYCEYNPYLHKILFNKSIPRIGVKIAGKTIQLEDLVLTIPLQKNIHSLHTLHLAANPMEFTLCNMDETNNLEYSNLFASFKQEWKLRNMEFYKQSAVSKQKSTGDSCLLFTFDPVEKRGDVVCISYRDNKSIIPNYDEYGRTVSVSIYYKLEDGVEVIDTYDSSKMYRHTNIPPDDKTTSESGWYLQQTSIHGFTRIPVLYQRGYVAWEFSQSLIEMLELILNIYAVVIKRYGNFAIWLKGTVDEDTFQSDGTTMIINDNNVDGNGDMKVLEFPKPEGMIEYINYLKREISLASSVTFIVPEDIKVSGDISGTAIMLTMKNDIAMAEQSKTEWTDFANGMTKLFAEMLSLEAGDITKYSKLRISAAFTTWMPESKTVTINNLVSQRGSKLISQRTASELAPDAAPDEENRLRLEVDATQEIL